MALVEIVQAIHKAQPLSLRLYAVNGATVYVRKPDGSEEPVYSKTNAQLDSEAVLVTQPLTSQNGRIEGWVEEGRHLDLVVSKPGEIVGYTQRIVSGGGPIGPAGPTGSQGPAGEVTHAMMRRGSFSATTGRTSGQSIAATTWATVILGAEDWDVSAWFDTVSHRFTPQVAGYYRFNAMASWGSNLAQYVFTTLGLFKNGALAKRLDGLEVPRVSNTVYIAGSATVLLNGTTDYVDLRVYHNDAAARDLAFSATDVYFQGELIAPSA